MSVWTINGRAFSELGLGNLTRSLSSAATDTVRFTAVGAAFDSDALFQYRQTVSIKRDGVQWFLGSVTKVPRSGSGPSESLSYEVSGPWRWLEECVYQQAWSVWSASEKKLTQVTKSRVVLGQGTGGQRLTTGQQIQAVLEYAASRGAPIAVGAIDADMELPFDEQVDVYCSQAIMAMLRMHPDCVCWWDYTTPSPTFHCRRRSALQAVSIPLSEHESVSIVARNDLVIPGCVVRFEQTNTVSTDDPDGSGPLQARDVTYNTVVEQTAGDASHLAAVVSTIQLAGSRRTSFSQWIKTERIPSDLADVEWWVSHIPVLAKEDQATMTLGNPRRSITTDTGRFDRLLIEGSVQPWMPVEVREEEFFVDVRTKTVLDDGTMKEATRTESFRAFATNAKTGTDEERVYRRTSSFEAGETIPAGFATKLYAAWSQLHFDGAITTHAEEVSGRMGIAINIPNGRAEWRSMNAMVQQVSEQVDSGVTTYTFGPPRHLSVDDLINILTNFRKRGPAYHYRERSNGEVDDGSDGGQVLGGKAARNEHSSGRELVHKLVMTSAGRKITLDPEAIPPLAADIRPREITVCVDGQPRKVIFLCSEPY